MSKKLRIDIILGNVSVSDEDSGNFELARIIREIAIKVENGAADGYALDYNGHKIATFKTMRNQSKKN